MGLAKDDPKAVACIEAVIKVLAEHGFTLGHEDVNGAFVLQPRTDRELVDINEGWIREAFLDGSEG